LAANFAQKFTVHNPKKEPLRIESKTDKKKIILILKSEFTMPVGREEEFQSRRGWQGMVYNYARQKLLITVGFSKVISSDLNSNISLNSNENTGLI
jgi:hypothetical protein